MIGGSKKLVHLKGNDDLSPFTQLHELGLETGLLIYFSWAAPVAYGRSQARDRIRTTAAGLCHSRSKRDLCCSCDLHYSSWQHWILNPLSKARDRIHILMNTSQVHNLLSHSGNSPGILILSPLNFFYRLVCYAL